MAISVSTDSAKIEQVATISAGNDPAIRKLIAESYAKSRKERTFPDRSTGASS